MSGTFLVAEQSGEVKVVQNGTVLPTDFLDVSSQIVSGGEQGLLGLALAPDYATSGRLWINFTDTAGNTVVARFVRSSVNPLVADASSRVDLMWPGGQRFIAQPFANHNGGNLVFGPDGYLYIGMGDGGSGDDPNNNAQNPASLLGKMLRIDVMVPDSDPEGYDVPPTNPFVGSSGVLPEIWDFGFRNPWRYSFDDITRGGTGALVIGDVGESSWEEVDYEPAGQGGRNYGWRNREGAHDNVTTQPPAFLPLIDPILEYPHTEGTVITGGVVYRGSALGSSYAGRYFFADFGASRVWSVALTINATTGEATASGLTEHTSELGNAASAVSSFATDASGEIYLLNYSAGTIYRLDSPASSGGCTTADPFASIGGGVCEDGNWFPPGYPGVGGSTTTPPPSSGTCTTPDPFAAMGGGTCSDGNWFPPGYPGVSSGSTTPPSTPPPSTPPPSSETCSTPDPFAGIGGGTCSGGNWFPPGYPGVSSGSTTPPSTPPPSSETCSTPDPFAGIGGGTCSGGSWFPPGYPGVSSGSTTSPSSPAPASDTCSTPDPFIANGGGTCVDGSWFPSGYPQAPQD